MNRDMCDAQGVNEEKVRRVQKQMPDAATLHKSPIFLRRSATYARENRLCAVQSRIVRLRSRRARQINVDLLMTVAITGAMCRRRFG